MCADGDGARMAVSTSVQSHRGNFQPTFSSGMRPADEEMSAMLQGHHAPIVSAGLDDLASYPFAFYQSGSYAASQSRPVGSVQRRPGFKMEEKYVLEAKCEALDASVLRNGASYGPVYENSGASAMDPSVSMGLHRYHSAPASTFLAEMNEAQMGNSGMLSLFADGGLTPITENMDMERMSGTAESNEFEHFLAPENDFSRRAAFPASVRKVEDATHHDSFGASFQGGKSELLRQTSLPAGGLSLSQLKTCLQDRMGENGSERSSSRTSEDNNHVMNGYAASMYSQEEFLWKSPTSPAKRQRGMDGESETSSGSGEGPAYRNGQQGGLVRHMSLPSPTGGPCSPENGFGAVAMRTRAKRGCATHPRSIAERVRRTKISERMKRLQDLVPDLDKQTNTAEMLDETVEYVKSLQRQVQELNETVAQLKAASAQKTLEVGQKKSK